MGTSRLERLAPLTGVLFAVIMVVGFLVVGDTPDTDATPAEIFDHYDDEGRIFFGVIALLLAAVALMFFAGALRRHLASVGPEWLASVVLAGAAVFAAGLGMFLSSQVSLVTAEDDQVEAAVQALNIIDNSNFGPAVIGLTIMYLATAWHVLASRSLPIWIGWLSLVIGIVAVLGPLGFIAFLAFPLWVLIVSIAVFRRASAPTPPLEVRTAA